jgi:hypothetical protein
MKLFHQLDHEQQHAAIHYCIDLVLNNMMEEGVDAPCEHDDPEEAEMKQKMADAIEHAKTLPTYEDQLDFIMADEDLNNILHSIAESMAMTVYFHDDSEMIIFESEITDEEDGDEVKEDDMLVVAKDDKKMLN